MTIIRQLNISCFRNITSAHLNPNSHFNLIYGQNGGGKTSLLESIYYLSLGRSFRSGYHADRLIQRAEEQFSIFAKLENTNLGTEKHISGSQRLRMDEKDISAFSEFAKHLPLQLINPDAYALINEGPKVRREFLDWGVFHVEPQFLNKWRESQRATKQRNLCLKQRAPHQETLLWDPVLSEAGEWVAQQRKDYFDEWCPLFKSILESLLPLKELSLNYYPGWPSDKTLQAALEAALIRDYQLGYTQYGPHRAELEVKVEGQPAKDVLSRGQQKLFVYAMRLAQGMLFAEQKNQRCIYLIDDLPAELDRNHQEKLFEMLSRLGAQVFLTSIHLKDMEVFNHYAQSCTTFHVERGQIKQLHKKERLNVI